MLSLVSEMAAKKHVFTFSEKKLFMNILKPYVEIVENKNTDSSTLRLKNMAWEKIAKEYNSSPQVETMVHPKQLRRLFMNLKQRQREANRKKRLLRMASAADPAIKVEIEENDLEPGFQESDEVPIDFVNTSDSNEADLTRIPTPPPTNRPAHAVCVTSSLSLKEQQQYFLEKEYEDKLNRATELHAMEKELLSLKIREAKARAERAELLLQRERSHQGAPVGRQVEAPAAPVSGTPVAQLAEFVRDYQS